ncbi:MAG: hypothetical protein M4579_000152 [Chaenotheca gracillima]|nr:MAG: hypothetical protein M4579_000152 [Chaenotheca gracillima]
MVQRKRPSPDQADESKASQRLPPSAKKARRSSQTDDASRKSADDFAPRRSSRNTKSGPTQEITPQEPEAPQVAPKVPSKAKKGPPKTSTTPNASSDKAATEETPQSDTGYGKQYWLMKAEPESRLESGVDVAFSIDDLKAAKEPEGWDARNNMRQMRKGDLAFFYHSNCKTPGIAGIMEIVEEASDDPSAIDPKHPYHDPKSTAENPKWSIVHVEFRRKLKDLVSLGQLRIWGQPGGALENMALLKQSRLSVSKVREVEWDFIMDHAQLES